MEGWRTDEVAMLGSTGDSAEHGYRDMPELERGSGCVFHTSLSVIYVRNRYTNELFSATKSVLICVNLPVSKVFLCKGCQKLSY